MFRIAGMSMSPVLDDGDYVISKALLPDDQLSVDDIVVFNHSKNNCPIRSATRFLRHVHV